MKRKQLTEARQKTAVELEAQVEETRGKIVKLKMEEGAGKIKNKHLLARTRDDLAVFLTMAKEKRLEEKKE